MQIQLGTLHFEMPEVTVSDLEILAEIVDAERPDGVRGAIEFDKRLVAWASGKPPEEIAAVKVGFAELEAAAKAILTAAGLRAGEAVPAVAGSPSN